MGLILPFVDGSSDGGAFPAEPADGGHVGAVRADALAAFSARGAGFVGRELVGRPFFMGGFSTLAGDFTLFFQVH
jgi:hypothetical protein